MYKYCFHGFSRFQCTIVKFSSDRALQDSALHSLQARARIPTNDHRQSEEVRDSRDVEDRTRPPAGHFAFHRLLNHRLPIRGLPLIPLALEALVSGLFASETVAFYLIAFQSLTYESVAYESLAFDHLFYI